MSLRCELICLTVQPDYLTNIFTVRASLYFDTLGRRATQPADALGLETIVSLLEELPPLSPRDLVGCRHRAALRRHKDPQAQQKQQTQQAAPRLHIPQDLEAYTEAIQHKVNATIRREMVFQCLPNVPRIGDKVFPSRVNIDPADPETAVEQTLEAMAAGVRLITRPVVAEGPFRVELDLLVRADLGKGVDEFMQYTPVAISSHSVARRAKSTQLADCRVTDIGALGLAVPVPINFRHRAAAGDAQKVAMAHVVLQQWGFAADTVALIGRAGPGRPRCFFFDAPSVLPGLQAALEEPIPSGPRRIKECQTCEFHNHCRAQLLQELEISLLLPGDKARSWREKGIETLPQLAASGNGEHPQLAQAWMDGQAALRRPQERWFEQPELWGGAKRNTDGGLRDWVEIDVDMEAHPNRGTFLWGTFDGSRYIGFGDFSREGDEGQHVAEFWHWMQARKDHAVAAGKNFQVWVYAAQGENYWLRHAAERYGGRRYKIDGMNQQVTMPTLEQVNAFIASEHWCDCFSLVKKALAPTDSLGLKTVAPLAGFEFSQAGINGKAAVELFEQAIGGSRGTAQAARRKLERYNADDCVATSTVRAWLRRGAPGLQELRRQ